MFSKADCLASLKMQGCARIGRNLWTDGEYAYRLVRDRAGYKLKAARLDGRAVTMREAMTPMFLAWQAAGRPEAIA